MAFPTFGRLAHLYHRRMFRLFGGRLWEMVKAPELANDPEFQQAAWKVARGMVAEVAKENAKSWRAAAHKSTRAGEIYRALQSELHQLGFASELDRLAARNADLIRSLPIEISHGITRRAAELQRDGARPAELERDIREMAKGAAESRIRLIARTEISRAETDLTRWRSEEIGIDWYQWQTAEDTRVRPAHENLDGVLVMWRNPPAPERLIGEKSRLGYYHPGQAPNCRCLSLPLVSIGDVKWPARVLRGERIVRMTRAEFTRSAGVRIAA